MNRKRSGPTLSVLLLAALAWPAAAETIYLATNDENLITIDSAAPGTILTTVPITGLAAGEFISGLDFRPATGQLYVLIGLLNEDDDPSRLATSASTSRRTPASHSPRSRRWAPSPPVSSRSI